ncbi:MAG TPA: hypothetical protein VJ654_18835, partial [Noviherbaspirillum sp.]|nr:hypothetical protein [Noviherbaspirillum sp.]
FDNFQQPEKIMRTFIAVLLFTFTTCSLAATQQQCEALMKPVEPKLASMQKLEDDAKPTPQTCALGKEVIQLYVNYTAQADKLNCPFAYIPGQQIGGKAERANLIADMKQAYNEKCR